MFGLLVAPFVGVAFRIKMIKMGKKEFNVETLDANDIYISQIFGESCMKKDKFK